MQVTDINKFMELGEDDESEYLSAESFVVPDIAHFLGTADRRAKYKRKQAELKKVKRSSLDEYEVALVG